MNPVSNRVGINQGTHEQLERILEIVKGQLKIIIQENLVHLILFGSQARRDARLEAEAFLLGDELTFSSHSAVISAFGRLFAKEKRLPVDYHRYLIMD